MLSSFLDPLLRGAVMPEVLPVDSRSSSITAPSLTYPESGSSKGFFRNPLSEFIYVRTYSRWLEAEGRRETWDESVSRYFDFLAQERPEVPQAVLQECRQAVLDMEVMPSMRALWSAGEAARRDNTCVYNCSFHPVDNLRAFSELLHVLMCGTGCGFSVEKEFVSNLPPVGDLKGGDPIPYVIGDSTEGWADALFFGMTHWWKGYRVAFDYSQIRAAGSVLKIKGGRSSGPDPLRRLMEFAEEVVLGAAGRRIKPIECHDICCQIAEIVMVGGFRRAALISISSPDDEEMRHAKDWSRGDFPTIRYMSNNSAYWLDRPSEEVFWGEWSALVRSKSGERGFLIDNWHKRAALREPNTCRTNPCISVRSWVNTLNGPRQVSQLIGQPFEAIVDGKVYSSSDRGFWLTGEKELFRLATTEGYSLELTGNHKVCRVVQSRRVQRFEWVEASELEAGDLIRLNNHRAVELAGDEVAKARGWLMGSLLGDGTFTVESSETKSDHGHLRFWGDDAEHMAVQALERVKTAGLRIRADAKPNQNKTNGCWQVSSTALAGMAETTYGMVPASKTITRKLEQETEDFISGFLSGLFDADGSVQGSQEKGVSVRLGQANLNTLEAAQRMLLRLGVVSTIYKERQPEGYRNLPDGKGGYGSYWCKAMHELVIAKDNLFQFESMVGFTEPAKAALLVDLLGQYRRQPNRERFVVRVESMTSMGVEKVYDCTVPELGAFDANGLYVHNCSEISLRFSRATDPWTGEGGGGSFCVSGDTPLITRQGLYNIKDVVGKSVEIWNGERWSEVRPFQTGIGQKLYRVHMSDGSYLDTTAYHRFSVSTKDVRSGKFKAMTVAEMLDNPIKAARRTEPFQIVQEGGQSVGSDWAYTMGAIVGDGTVRRKTRKSGYVWEGSYAESFGAKDSVMPIQGVAGNPRVANAGNLALQKVSYFCANHDPEMVSALKTDPEALNGVFQWCREDILSFLAGWLDADGTATDTGRVRLYLSGEARARKVQLLLTRCGIRSSIGLLGRAGTETNLGVRRKDLWYVDITDCASIPCHRLDTSRGHKPRFKSKFQTIRSIEELPGLHHTFCFEEPERHMGVFGNTLTYQCNLTAAVMRPWDTEASMARKVRLATWLGVIQASFTDFPYLRPAWSEICNQDRLLGVDITGQCDNPALSQNWQVMLNLNRVAQDTAAEAAGWMDLPFPVAITCGKPSGNSSQLLDCASGFHPRHSRYYFRHVRIAASDPLFALVRDSGVPVFKENGQEHLSDEEVSVWVARFPVKAPDHAVLREDETALGQLDRYLNIMRTWCSERGHNQSATIYVREEEWAEVGQWVYDHFDEITGLSFLPYDGGRYTLAPYEEVTASQYREAVNDFPEIDYALLSYYEKEDRGGGSAELACSGGACEVDWSLEAEQASKA